MAEPAGAPAPVVLAVGATSVDRWATLGAAGAGAAVAVAGFEPKKPNPLDCGGALGVEGFTLTAVLAGVGAGAGAVAWRLEDDEPNEPKPPLGFEGAGAADWAGAEGLELDEELEPNEPKLDFPVLEDDEEELPLELEEEDDEEREELEDDEELEELDFAASETMGLIARAILSIATLNSEVRDLVIRGPSLMMVGSCWPEL